MNDDYTLEEKFIIKRHKVISKVIKTNGPIKFSKNKKDPFDTPKNETTFTDLLVIYKCLLLR